MNVEESFVVDQPRAALWAFVQDVERVARCLPGVEDVVASGPDDLTMLVTQKLGPFSATFDTKMHIEERVDGEAIRFTAVGQTVRGASGNLRAANVVRLEDDGAATRVVIEAELALGGMLGAVGQKVVAKQAAKVTRQFAENLNAEVTGPGA
ncbi:MAG: CoxG family protein [Gaiellales bacterium]